MNIKELVDNIPILLLYFIPGYIALSIKKYFRSEYEIKDTHLLMMSLIVSFVLKSFIDFFVGILNNILKLEFQLSQENESILLILLSLVVGLAWCRIYDMEKLKKWINKFMDKDIDFSTNVWNIALESKEGAWVTVYIKDEDLVYTGVLSKYTIDPDDKNREILLSRYSKYNMTTGKLIQEFNDEDNCVLIKCNEMNRIEILK